MGLKPVSLACVFDFHDFFFFFAIFHFALNFTVGTALPRCVLLKLWVEIEFFFFPSFCGIFPGQDQIHVSCLDRWVLYH